ncbi:MAG: deaminase, partial [Acidobacteriota bacterium]
MTSSDDIRWLQECAKLAASSDDSETSIGCVIVAAEGNLVAEGYNSLPQGVDIRPDRLMRPTKYLWIEHAERNAIFSAARAGNALHGCTIYVELLPCADCARAIIQSGIVAIVTSLKRAATYSSARYSEEHIVAST